MLKDAKGHELAECYSCGDPEGLKLHTAWVQKQGSSGICS